jgi:hypothetical protein
VIIAHLFRRQTSSAAVTVMASSMTCLHCASADDHRPRMTIVISHAASSDARVRLDKSVDGPDERWRQKL